ncbi:MAG: APC family permease [Wenzhouxiangellaceae bacterium]|nr:APC family permease [Wenzhouxiangellaceae bacterium]
MSDESKSGGRLGPASLVSLATGGMVGGGIYVALGVVVEAAGQWAWLSFALAGVIAVTTAYAYATLTNHFESSGGAFGFLEHIDRSGFAGSLSWVLLVAYTLTIALYAYAFGEYVSHALDWSAPWPKVLSLIVLAGLTALNLVGVGKVKGVEITIVTGNLLVLLILAVVGLVGWWSPERLVAPQGPMPAWNAWMGAAAIFVAYEGFQLLTYEYDEVRDPKRILAPSLVGSALAVVLIYAVVAVGATMIAGAGTVIEHKSIALSEAAVLAAGSPGLVVMTIAAAFATSAAIISTLVSSGKLARRVSDDGELPAWFDHRNAEDVPDRPIMLLGAAAAVLVWVGSLAALVEAASLAFLAAFSAVHTIALRRGIGHAWVSWLAMGFTAVIGALLIVRLATTKPVALSLILALFAIAWLVRPWLLRHVRTEQGG